MLCGTFSARSGGLFDIFLANSDSMYSFMNLTSVDLRHDGGGLRMSLSSVSKLLQLIFLCAEI